MMKLALSLAFVPATATSQQAVADSIMAACIARDTSTAWVQASMAWSNEQPGSWSNDSLRLVLIEMAEADQAVREGFADSISNTAFMRRMAEQDSMRLAQLRGIISRFGWPTRSLVGARGASAAFLIAQHNGPIQQEALRLMRALPKGQVQLSELAMLEDRVLTSDGRPQKYGTQFKPPVGDVMEFFPIDSVTRVEARRATVGLPPMGVYLCMMQGFTGKAPRFPP